MKTKETAKHNIVQSLLPLAVDINSVKLDPKNARKHNPRNLEAIKKSLEAYGQRKPIVVNKETCIIEAGNGLFTAAKELGWEKIAAVFVLDDKEVATGYALMDNQSALLAEWDLPVLKDLLQNLDDGQTDMSLTGFSTVEIEDLMTQFNTPSQGLTDDDAIPEEAPPICKKGNLWKLGNHRLLCGDSTKKEDVELLMNGQRAILFATDPPYLVDYDGKNHPNAWNKPDKNKDWSGSYGDVNWDESDITLTLYDEFIAVAKEIAITENAAWYCWHASRHQAKVEAIWQKHGAFVHQQIIWAKDRPILTRSWYMWQHEPCFFGWIKGNEPPRVSKDYPHTVWNVNTVSPGTKTDHPTSKPVALFETPILQHTHLNEICYEPFAGSGTQIIAAEKHSRQCYAMELSEKYCDVIIKRWQDYTGEKAELING